MIKFIQMVIAKVALLAVLLAGVPTTAMVLMTSEAFACARVTVNCDPAIPAPGNEYQGSLNLRLTHWVRVCHPDYYQLAEPRWYSFAFISNESKLGALINQVRRTGMANEEVEVRGQECVTHWYEPGRVLVVVTPCRVPGMNVFLVTQPLTAQDHGTTVRFYDHSELRQYMFPA